MNVAPVETNVEAGWKTYLKGIVFLLPAAMIYMIVLVKVVPKFKEVWILGGIPISEAGWGWHTPFYMGEHGRLIVVAVILAFVVLEFLSRTMWARYRRFVVGIVVWLLNVYVLLSLGCFFILSVMAASGMAHPK